MVQAVPPTRAPSSPPSSFSTASSVVPCHGTWVLSPAFCFLATCSGSTPALVMALASTLSTTACDWATTPTFQPCFTRAAMTWEATNVLPVPGGPCTAR